MNSKSVAHASLIQASVYAFVALMALLVVTASEVLLVVFGGILLAILFHGTWRLDTSQDGIESDCCTGNRSAAAVDHGIVRLVDCSRHR